MNRYFKEVLDTHELIRDWLGNAETPLETCDDLLSRFSPDFSMVPPSGVFFDFNALNRFFRAQLGARAGLIIEIADLQIIAESERGATVTYTERQIIPGQNTTQRFATAVFDINPDGRVMWRHLHETFYSA